jgi:hypothetical protein
MNYILFVCVVVLYIVITTIYHERVSEGFAAPAAAKPPGCPPVPACPAIPACPNPIPKIAKSIDDVNNEILQRQKDVGCGDSRTKDPLSPEMSVELAQTVGQCYEINYFKNTLLKKISDSLK